MRSSGAGRKDPSIVAANNANNRGVGSASENTLFFASGSPHTTVTSGGEGGSSSSYFPSYQPGAGGSTAAFSQGGSSQVSMEALVKGRGSPTDYGGSSPTQRGEAKPTRSAAQPHPPNTNRRLPDDDDASSVHSSQNTASRGAFNTASHFSGDENAAMIAGGGTTLHSNSNATSARSNYYHPNAYMAQNPSHTTLAGGSGHISDPQFGEGGGGGVGTTGSTGIVPSATSSNRSVSCFILLGQLSLLVVASIIFMFGVTGTAERVTGLEGWDEVFTVCGMLFIFPILLFLYRLIAPMIPRLPPRRENTVWFWLLRAVLVGSFILQSAFFLIYLAKYNGDWYYFFILPDALICLMMLASTRLTTLWSYLYISVMATKMGLFWFNLDPSNGPNVFQEKGNKYGVNGFLALLMLILPMIHYPVIISRLEAGMGMTEAYTTNMAAVFAHILHIMDSLELYMQGQTRRALAADVQYMLLIFALMGFVACSIYYITLFFRDEAAEKIIRRFQSNVLGDLETSKDESLLHYFMWTMIFIDLPYASMRFVAFCVHNNTKLSPFFAKNIAMIGSVLMLLFYNNYQNTRAVKKERTNAK